MYLVILHLWDLKKCRSDLIPQSITLDRRVSSLSCGDVIVHRGRLLKSVAKVSSSVTSVPRTIILFLTFFTYHFIRVRSFRDKYRVSVETLSHTAKSIVEFFSIHFLLISSQLPNCHLSCSINRMENLTCCRDERVGLPLTELYRISPRTNKFIS